MRCAKAWFQSFLKTSLYHQQVFPLLCSWECSRILAVTKFTGILFATTWIEWFLRAVPSYLGSVLFDQRLNMISGQVRSFALGLCFLNEVFLVLIVCLVRVWNTDYLKKKKGRSDGTAELIVDCQAILRYGQICKDWEKVNYLRHW